MTPNNAIAYKNSNKSRICDGIVPATAKPFELIYSIRWKQIITMILM